MAEMEKIILAAVSENNVIGMDGKMPWHIPEDMKHFRKLTIGYPVIMGRKTYESIGKPLDKRINLVLTKKGKFEENGIKICYSIGDAFEEARMYNGLLQDFNQLSKYPHECKNQVYIIGGEQVFRQTIGSADRLELTRIHQNVRGNSFFPEINNGWEEISRQDFPGQNSVPPYSFVSYKRI